MSVEDLKKYGKMAVEDPAVRATAKSIGLQNLKGQIDYAKTLGLAFDENDMKALSKEYQPKGELNENDLAQVAGGVVSSTSAAVVGAIVVAASVVAVTAATTSGKGW